MLEKSVDDLVKFYLLLIYVLIRVYSTAAARCQKLILILILLIQHNTETSSAVQSSIKL